MSDVVTFKNDRPVLDGPGGKAWTVDNLGASDFDLTDAPCRYLTSSAPGVLEVTTIMGDRLQIPIVAGVNPCRLQAIHASGSDAGFLDGSILLVAWGN